MSNELMRSGSVDMTAIEAVIMQGDLKALTPAQRVQYHKAVCDSLGLNPLTKPFEYITLNGKLTLYARKDATDQLRKINGISISPPAVQFAEGLVVVTVTATDKAGRTDTDLGAVSIEGLKGEARANAIMKAVTKSKRRVTLSISGLGFSDETEVETIPGAERVTVTEDGEILSASGNGKPAPEPEYDFKGAIARINTLSIEAFGDEWKNGLAKEYAAKQGFVWKSATAEQLEACIDWLEAQRPPEAEAA